MKPRDLRALAFKLADEHALGIVDSSCVPADEWRPDADGVYGFGRRQWFVPGPNDSDRALVLYALRYLVPRRLVVWNRRARIVTLRD